MGAICRGSALRWDTEGEVVGAKPRGCVQQLLFSPCTSLATWKCERGRALAGKRWRRQQNIRSHQQTSRTSSGMDRILGSYIYLTRAMPWCFLDFCLLLSLSPGFPQRASILLEVQWLKLDTTPYKTLPLAAYGTEVPSHVLQYATFVKYLIFLFRREKLREGPVEGRWLGAGSLALWGEAWGPGLAWEKVTLGTKTERCWWQEKLLPQEDKARWGTGCSGQLSSVCPWRFSRPDWMNQPGLISQLLLLWAGLGMETSWAPFQPELSCDLFAYSFARLLYLIWSILKLPDLFVSSPHHPVKLSSSFSCYFICVFNLAFPRNTLILLNFIWPISVSSSNPFSVLTLFWKVLDSWILPREPELSSKPVHGASHCRLPWRVAVQLSLNTNNYSLNVHFNFLCNHCNLTQATLCMGHVTRCHIRSGTVSVQVLLCFSLLLLI